MGPAKATDHQQLLWPGSLPLSSHEHPSGCLNKPLTFYGPQFPPLSNGVGGFREMEIQHASDALLLIITAHVSLWSLKGPLRASILNPQPLP